MRPSQSSKVPSPGSNRRDFIVAVACGVGILGFVLYGIFSMRTNQREVSRAMLSGKIVEKSFKPAPEEQISFGNKGLKTERIAGAFLLRVHVQEENRTFDVPVTESIYNSVGIGDNFTFGRPRSELRSPGSGAQP